VDIEALLKRQDEWRAESHREQERIRQVCAGPFGGRYGAGVKTALFLEIHWDRFAAWCEARGVDPSPCRSWIDEHLALLRVARAVSQGIANAQE
jgi:hypothetical protein